MNKLNDRNLFGLFLQYFRIDEIKKLIEKDKYISNFVIRNKWCISNIDSEIIYWTERKFIKNPIKLEIQTLTLHKYEYGNYKKEILYTFRIEDLAKYLIWDVNFRPNPDRETIEFIENHDHERENFTTESYGGFSYYNHIYTIDEVFPNKFIKSNHTLLECLFDLSFRTRYVDTRLAFKLEESKFIYRKIKERKPIIDRIRNERLEKIYRRDKCQIL